METFPVAALCAKLGLTGEPRRFPDGSLPVYGIGDDLVLKLYPPEDADEADAETTVLRILDGRLSVPTPGVERTGEHDGWRYVLMRRLRGESLAVVWPGLSASDRTELAARLGEVLAELHAVTDPRIGVLEPRDWGEFVRDRAEVTVAQQRGSGLDERWLEQIPAFLDSVDLGSPPSVLLHTEFLREHVVVRPERGRWTVSGLLDFEPAMPGAAEYDLVAARVFLAGEDPAFLRTLLHAYGYSPAELDEDFARRCLAYTLLHRYSNLAAYLRRLPPAPTLDALAPAWFG
ncbi:phosphotransferase family protein [Prauserella cavernicola]|uniref:Aminoglycoside 3'-phosphotransferase/choline kinase family protein n=1 Tax=Prauserella cavernicola TaxID=2800127 RepID=A0A934QUP2_9PSEU|nr:aminoglycoside 3'-phosphotransferase/choline kinase family protein [Prauserella cavernicola]MBK1786906.1 aminoglycoside 3'-phosphotransferase/choline kinase family protein [Prauserella cavernicola]